jgi:hypothetical protein
VRLNNLLPHLVDRGLRKQLPLIRRLSENRQGVPETMKKLSACLLFAVLSQSVWALEPADQQRLNGIQQRWAHIQYEVAEKQRAAAFEQLSPKPLPSLHSARRWPKRGSGRHRHQQLGRRSGRARCLGQGQRRQGRSGKALTLDPKALQGSAYTSLAALYDRVPGWPIGFGDATRPSNCSNKRCN